MSNLSRFVFSAYFDRIIGNHSIEQGIYGESHFENIHIMTRRDEANDGAPKVVAIERPSFQDQMWLLAAGFDPEKVGSQYSIAEAPLQLIIAPLRALRARRKPAFIVRVDGKRAGYIGPNPLSGNIEYFVQPWARGGIGAEIIAAYFRRVPSPREHVLRFFVAGHNARSRRALVKALEAVNWEMESHYWIEPHGHGEVFIIRRSASVQS
jgi:hypothetical protein